MTKTVLLTGITGFIAKRIAADLLAKGYTVKGTLRSMSRADEVRAAVGDHANLSFVELDLNSDDGWQAAMDGVDVLMHTASPFPMSDPKDENDVIGPAVEGTLRAMKAAAQAGVKQVVLTSSMVAIMYGPHAGKGKITEDDWTDITHPSVNVYSKSKTLAEKAARDFADQTEGMQITTIHPGLVLGTPMDKHYGTSLEVVDRMLAGKDPMVPAIDMPVVDIEDVSALHIAAMENPALAGRRLLAVADTITFPKLAKHLAAKFPNKKIPTKVAPKFLLKAFGLFDPAIKSIVPLVGVTFDIDTSATRDATGHSFVSPHEAATRSAAFILAQS